MSMALGIGVAVPKVSSAGESLDEDTLYVDDAETNVYMTDDAKTQPLETEDP